MKKIKKVLIASFISGAIILSSSNIMVDARQITPEEIKKEFDNGPIDVNELIVGNSYDSYLYGYYIINPNNKTYKYGTYSTPDNSPIYKGETGESSTTVKLLKDDVWPQKKYQYLPKYAYRCYYMGMVEAPYQTQGAGRHNAGDTITVTHGRLESSTYEASISISLGIKNIIKGGAEFCDMFSAEVSTELSISVGTTFTMATTYQTQDSYTYTYNLRYDGYYQLQRRARYNMYALALYEIEYYPKVTSKQVFLHKDKHYDYDSGTKKYKFLGLEESYNFTGDIGPCVSKYSFDSNNIMYYDDEIFDSAVMYL